MRPTGLRALPIIALLTLWTVPASAAGPDAGFSCPAAITPASVDETRPRRGGSGAFVSLPKDAPAPATADALAEAQRLRGSIRRVRLRGREKLVALTFDLCEQPGEVAGYDGPVFDALRAHDVRATIFAGGKWLLSHAGRAGELIVDPRFEIASHGWAHRNVRGLAGPRLAEEILAPQRAYELVRARLAAHQCFASPAATPPAAMRLFRFPYGACSPAALDEVAGAGLLAIQWNLSTGDPAPTQSAAAIARILLAAKPGDIVIMHANGRGYHTAEALRIALPQMLARGFKLVTVSELIAAGDPVITPTCYDSRPGDVDRYDALFRRPDPEVPRERAAAPVPR